MILKKYKEMLLGISILALSIAYFYTTTLFKLKIETTFNAKYIPYLLASIAFILGVAQCIFGYRVAKSYKVTEEESKDIKAVILMFGLIVVYVAVLRKIGFLIDTTVLMFIQMMLLSPKEKRNIPFFAIISVCATVIIYYAFRSGLNLMLPSGLLG
ncbi:MAG: tripartite tricarboxylate transporter TctB family protein [Clostridia bacterium]